MKIALGVVTAIGIYGGYSIGLNEFMRIDSIPDALTVIPQVLIVGTGNLLSLVLN